MCFSSHKMKKLYKFRSQNLQLVQQKKYNAVCLLHQPCNSKVIYSGSTGSPEYA